MAVDGRALAFGIAVASATGLLFGLVPALHAARPDVAQVLRRSSPAAGHDASGRTRGILIVAEMALAVVLLAGAGLLTRSFLRLVDTDPGIRTDHVVTFSVSLPDSRYPNLRQLRDFTDRMVARLRQLPGAQDVGVTYKEPFTTTGFAFSYEVAGRPPLEPGTEPSAQARPATPGFFPALEDHLRAQYPALTDIHVTDAVATQEVDASVKPYRRWYRVTFTSPD